MGTLDNLLEDIWAMVASCPHRLRDEGKGLEVRSLDSWLVHLEERDDPFHELNRAVHYEDVYGAGWSLATDGAAAKETRKLLEDVPVVSMLRDLKGRLDVPATGWPRRFVAMNGH